MSNPEHCQSRLEESILIPPMSSDTSMKHATDITILASPENGLNKGGRIILSHIQPISKRALEKQFGKFTDEEWELVIAHVLTNFERYPQL